MPDLRFSGGRVFIYKKRSITEVILRSFIIVLVVLISE